MSKSKYSIIVALIICIFSMSCDSDDSNSDGTPTAPNAEIENQFRLVNAFPGLNFDVLVDIQNVGDGSDRLFVVEQRGMILSINNISANSQNQVQTNSTDPVSNIFLDIQDRVTYDRAELGLLGLAFHPNHENNGLFYVYYTAGNPLRSVISEFSTSTDNTNIADPNSEVILLEFNQLHASHNGGQLVFGPQDGYLYISIGDGGPPDGMNVESQDLTNLLGSIIRIDINNLEPPLNYGIPPDNPFINNSQGILEEIYAYGLRNPWRMGFDPLTGNLWVGDVGQVTLEEIDIIQKGKNYGWPIMEGTSCFNPPSNCDKSGLELPIWEYPRGDIGRAIIGGNVYRGTELPELQGKYIYGDFISGRVWALSFEGFTATDNVELIEIPEENAFVITSFGQDDNGELYITGFDGNIYKLQRTQNSQ